MLTQLDIWKEPHQKKFILCQLKSSKTENVKEFMLMLKIVVLMMMPIVKELSLFQILISFLSTKLMFVLKLCPK